MTRRICLYGGPGVGKSTLAAATFARLKAQGHKIELVQEWIKGWAWEDRKVRGWDQLYILAKQLRLEDRLLSRGVSLVTDSPLIMQLAYQPDFMIAETRDLIDTFERQYPGEHYLLQRTVPYDPEGRWETPSQARCLDQEIHDLLDSYDFDYQILDPRCEVIE